MRDLIEQHDAFGRAMLADLTGRDGPTDRISEPVAAICDGPATHTHAGAGNALLSRRSAAMGELGAMAGEEMALQAAADTAEIALDYLTDDGPILTQSLAWIYAAAKGLMASAGPMPLVSDEPWEEPDADYRGRLFRAAGNKLEQWTDPADVAFAIEHRLDQYGGLLADGAEDAGLPRARLTPVELEADDAYAKRLGVDGRLWAANAPGCLDALGAEMGIPRAQLVPIVTTVEESPLPLKPWASPINARRVL